MRTRTIRCGVAVALAIVMPAVAAGGVGAASRAAPASLPAARAPGPPAGIAITVGSARAGGAIPVRILDGAGANELTASVCATPPAGVRTCANAPFAAGQRSVAVRVHAVRPGGWTVSVEVTAAGAATPTAARTVTRWVAPRYGRLRLLAAGDSEMQILDGMLAQDLARHGVNVTPDAHISTGLSNPWLFNWPLHAAGQVPSLRPDVTVVFIGPNEGYALRDGHTQVNCCSPAWVAGYANLVAQMMRTYLRGSAGRVYWVLGPTPGRADLRPVIDDVNAGIRAAAARFPGRVGLIAAGAFFTPGDRYRNYMTYRGQGLTIHEPDGIHLSASSDQLLAGIITRRLIADRVLR